VAAGVALDGMVPIGEMVDLARRAEARGVPSLWMAEHMGYRDGLASSMAFLAATRAITVAPTAISVFARHPMITAMTAATLEELAPGRTLLVLASGNPRALQEMGLAVSRPASLTREYVEVVRGLWRGEPLTYAGEHFRLKDARCHVRPARALPVYVAAMGPRMLELAGAVGDGVLLSAGLSPDAIRRALDRAAAGARRAGRDPRAVAGAGFVLAAIDEDGAAARRAAKRMLAYLFRNRFIAEDLAGGPVPVDREAAADAAARGDWDRAIALVPDPVVLRHAVAGTPAECRAQLAAFRAAGLTVPVLLAVGDEAARRLAVDLAATC
jgi:5,10-methylenetetrahydromethanopterin reductase